MQTSTLFDDEVSYLRESGLTRDGKYLVVNGKYYFDWNAGIFFSDIASRKVKELAPDWTDIGTGEKLDLKKPIKFSHHGYMARQAIVETYRKTWKHEVHVGTSDEGSELPDATMQTFASDDLNEVNATSQQVDPLTLVMFNEKVTNQIAILLKSSNPKLLKLFFLIIRQNNLEHHLTADLQVQIVKLIGDAYPDGDRKFDLATALNLKLCERDKKKGHSNELYGLMYEMRQLLVDTQELAA